MVVREGAKLGQMFAGLGEGMASRALTPEGDSFRGEGLSPGNHVLTILGEGVFVPQRTVEVIAGETREIAVEVLPAVAVNYEVAAPPRGSTWNAMQLEVRDASGRIVWRIATLVVNTFPSQSSVNLALGSYTFEARTDTGLVRGQAFEVEGVHHEPAPVRVDLHDC
ncbi:MAG: hypothetical protein AB1726_06405 [Planctomycetota bacterium]